MPVLRFTTDPETGHRLAIRMLSLGKWARPRDLGVDGEDLRAEVSALPLRGLGSEINGRVVTSFG